MSDTENITIIRGSYGYDLNFTIKDSSGSARDMTGYTATLQTWSPLVPGTLLMDDACTWTDASAGTCYYTVASSDFDTIGVYCYRIKATATGIIEYPLAGFLTVVQYGGNYCTLEEVKEELNIETENYDSVLQAMIGQAKTFIDDFCKREFDSTSETRYFDGSASPLFIDDLVSVTTLKVDEDGDGTYESTLTTSDYVLYPLNDTPKTRVEVSSDSDYGGFASGIKKGVEIVGTWGYSAVPTPIRRASIIQASRWFKRRESAYADVIGTTETGQLIMYKGLDPDVALILKSYVKRKV